MKVVTELFSETCPLKLDYPPPDFENVFLSKIWSVVCLFLEQFGLLAAFHIPLELLAEAELMCCSEACIGFVELVAVNVRIVHAWLHIWDITFASLDSICSNQWRSPTTWNKATVVFLSVAVVLRK